MKLRTVMWGHFWWSIGALYLLAPLAVLMTSMLFRSCTEASCMEMPPKLVTNSSHAAIRYMVSSKIKYRNFQITHVYFQAKADISTFYIQFNHIVTEYRHGFDVCPVHARAICGNMEE